MSPNDERYGLTSANRRQLTAAPGVRRVGRAYLNIWRRKSSVQPGGGEGQGKRKGVTVRWVKVSDLPKLHYHKQSSKAGKIAARPSSQSGDA
jgi:hypothetical protein